jgi:Spy/CpxP family protein refolding chaperone
MHNCNDAKCNGRRGWIRRAGLFAGVAALAGTLGLHAHAQGGPGFGGPFGGHHGGPMTPAQMEERGERMLKHLYIELDATPEQQQKIAPIVKGLMKELAPLRGQMMETRKQAMGLMSADTIDRAAIERLRGERLQRMDAVSKRMTQAMADVAEVLTPAQRKKLAERMQQRRGHGMMGWHRG